MTEITDTEAAEVLWASSEQGKAAHQAAWLKLRELGLVPSVDATQLGQIVYAAFLADLRVAAECVEDDEPVPAHDHHWSILGVQPHTPITPFVLIGGKPVPHTIALMRCSECGEPDTRMLPGEWTLHELREDPV